MSKIYNFSAQLTYEDDTHKDLDVEIIKRVSRHKFLLKIKIKANKLNKSITICKNGKIELEADVPKSCPTGCDCDSFFMTAEI
jgi:hypothetical protein